MGHSLGRAARVSEWVFPAVHPTYDASHRLLVRFPVEGAGTEAPALLLGREFFSEEELRSLGSLVSTCVIYFHSNGCDIGQCFEDMVTFRDGALDGDAVVLCPEYPGYGLLREYMPSVSGINLMAQAAWRFCTEGLGFRPAQIMLWGRSIGTGPATELAYSVASRARAGTRLAGADGTTVECSSPRRQSSVGASSSARPARGADAGADAGAGPVVGSARRAWPQRVRWQQGHACDGASSSEDDEVVPRLSEVPFSARRTPGTYFASAARPCDSDATMGVGADVTVRETFPSDSAGRTELKKGEKGLVVKIDDRGDALIDFQAHPRCQWIFRSNFGRLDIQMEDPPVGALILLAPLISVAAVVQHHIPSQLAASLVGPMWEVLERAKEPAMEGVPLLVIHPKCDEIVPSSHGQAVFEQATSRRKFGIWLCNATHNIPLEEEHLRIARDFLLDKNGRKRCGLKVGRDLGVAASDSEAEEDKEEVMRIAGRLVDLGLTGKAEETVVMTL